MVLGLEVQSTRQMDGLTKKLMSNFRVSYVLVLIIDDGEKRPDASARHALHFVNYARL